MEQEFRALLIATSTVTAVCGNRIDWGDSAQGAPMPRVVLNVIGNAEGLTQQGPDGLFSGRVQVDCYAISYAQAKTLARAVRSRLHGYAGGGFQLVTGASERDSRESGTNEAERPFRVSLDFLTEWRA